MKFDHVAEKVASLRSNRNFSLFMLGLTGGASAFGFIGGIGTAAVLTATAAVVYAGAAGVRHYKLNQWSKAQDLIEQNAQEKDISQALEQAAGASKKHNFVSSLPNLDAPSPRPARTAKVQQERAQSVSNTQVPSSAPKM